MSNMSNNCYSLCFRCLLIKSTSVTTVTSVTAFIFYFLMKSTSVTSVTSVTAFIFYFLMKSTSVTGVTNPTSSSHEINQCYKCYKSKNLHFSCLLIMPGRVTSTSVTTITPFILYVFSSNQPVLRVLQALQPLFSISYLSFR